MTFKTTNTYLPQISIASHFFKMPVISIIDSQLVKNMDNFLNYDLSTTSTSYARNNNHVSVV